MTDQEYQNEMLRIEQMKADAVIELVKTGLAIIEGAIVLALCYFYGIVGFFLSVFFIGMNAYNKRKAKE